MVNLNLYGDRSFALDLGNNNTLLTDRNNVLLSEPSYIVLNAENKTVKAVGNKAYDMFEKTHKEFKTVKPLRGGVIADFDSAEKMVKALVNKTFPSRFGWNNFNYIISGVPYYSTEVERRALRDILDQFRCRKKFLLFEPLAAALGMDLDIRQPDGKFLVDIGGGITEIVIISLSGIVSFNSIRTAGDTFDEEIQDYFRKIYNISIGIKTAELLKKSVGAVIEDIDNPPEPVEVRGKNLLTGIPVTRKVDHKEIAFILDKSVTKIEQAILNTLETCPPELAADIYDNGIYITGGSSLLRGFGKRLEEKVKVVVHTDPNALNSVLKGIQKVLNEAGKYKAVLME